MKITQQVDAYLTNVQLSRTVSPETERLYTLYLGKYLVFRKSRRLTRSSIPPAEVNAFLAWYDKKSLERRGRRLSIHAYDKIFDVLRTFCSWSSDLGHLKKNPFRFLKPPKVPKKTLRTIAPMPDVARFLSFVENRAPGARPNGLGLPTDKDAARRVLELEAYRSHALAARDAAFYGTLFYGGLRISEACPIDVDRDVDLGQGFISVRRGKGGEPRLIPIRRELRAILCRYIKLRARLLERFSITSSALFPSLPGHGRPWAGEAAAVKSAWMSKLLRTKYLPLMRLRGAPRVFMQRFTPHGFRHSIATYLLNHDVDLQDVQEFLGHQDPATTTLYNHQQPKHLQRMIARA